MGWAVLYIAFGVVALWLLGEVLLQYKARLRWRLLAFAGFMGVVLGVLLPSVFVIILGALAFGVGQTCVTLSFRRGFSTGWAVGGRPGASRRRRSGGAAALNDPVLKVSDVRYEDGEAPQGAPAGEDAGSAAAGFAGAARESVYEPQPLPDDTGQYGVYSESAPAGAQQQYAGFDTGQQQFADPYAGPYDYGTDTGQQSYAAYSDPYIGSGTTQGYGSYDSYAAPQQAYADPYAQNYGMDTPPGGVWVPQQRDNEPQPYAEEQPAPYPHGGEYGNGTGGGTGSGYLNEQQPYRY